jgi:pseudaminic acid biosynthesis-associated methylase
MNYNESVWAGNFGEEYTNRNVYNPKELDELYTNRYGASRTEMNCHFLKDISKDAQILEVGCNCGNQLLALEQQGFYNLTGIEINPKAADLARTRTHSPHPIFTGSALDLPFINNYFDVVFTSGLLIHINPMELIKVMGEIARVSKEYVWGFEYYSQGQTEVVYRGKTDVLWKNDYALMYSLYCDLKLVEEKFYYNEGNKKLADHMFILRKEN